MAFHVPERARDTTHPQLATTAADGNNGAFHVASVEPGWTLALICSDSTDDPALAADLGRWEHVSVHAYREGRWIRGPRQVFGPPARWREIQERTPTWREMCQVKDLCWDAEDVAIQFHPRRSQYVNCHPYTLHLWRPIDAVVPEPPPIYVGPRTADDLARLDTLAGPRV